MISDPAFIRSVISLCRKALSGDQSSIKSAEEQIAMMLNPQTGDIDLKIVTLFQIILSPSAVFDSVNNNLSDEELLGLKYSTNEVQLWSAICLKNYIKSSFETSECYGGVSDDLHNLIKTMLIILTLNSNKLCISKPVASQLENALLIISEEYFPKYMECILLFTSYCHISDINTGMMISTLTTRLQNEANKITNGAIFESACKDGLQKLNGSFNESQSITYLNYSDMLIKQLTGYVNVQQMILVYNKVLNNNNAVEISRAYFDFFDKLVDSAKIISKLTKEIGFNDLEITNFVKSINCLFPHHDTLSTHIFDPVKMVCEVVNTISDPLFYLDDRKLYDANLLQIDTNIPQMGSPHHNLQLFLNPNTYIVENLLYVDYFKDKLLALNLLRMFMKKYKTRLYCDDTLSELKLVLTLIDTHLLYLFKTCMGKFMEYIPIFTKINNLSIVILDLIQILTRITNIFCYIHSIDLPETFEDNCQIYFTGMMQLLQFNDQMIICCDSLGTVKKMKISVCKLFRYYAERYQEVYRPFVFNCVDRVIIMCRTSVSQDDDDDKLCCAVLDFLSAAVSTHWTTSDPSIVNPFSNSVFLTDVIKNIILPNIGLRESDLYLLEDSPVEFVQRELDTSSNCTCRRFSSITLLKKLVASYNGVTSILNDIAKNIGNSNDTELKELYLQLIICINFRNNNNEFNINQYYVDYLKNDFIQSSNNPLQKSNILVILAIIKYIYTFKNSIAVSELVILIPVLVQYINNQHDAIKSFASEAIARLLPLLSTYKLQLKGVLLQGLEYLLKLMSNSSTYNEFYMKCTMKLFLYLSRDICDSGLMMINIIINLIKNVSNNPVNPVYNHYLFESLSILLRIHIQGNNNTILNQIEDALIPTLALIIQQQLHPFIPYSLQILYLLLKHTNNRSSAFIQLFTHLITIDNWKISIANSQGLIKLLVCYLSKKDLFEKEIQLNIEKILNIFHYCLTHRKLSLNSLELLNGVIKHVPIGYYSTFLKTIVTVLLTYIHNNKTGGLTNVITSISLLILYLHIQKCDMTFVDILESIQHGIFFNFVQIVYVPNAKKAISLEAKKIHAVALSKLLSIPQIQNNSDVFLTLLEFLNDLISGVDMSVAAIKEEELFHNEFMDNIEQDVNFDVSFVRLQTLEDNKANKLLDSAINVQLVIKDILMPISSIIKNHNKYSAVISMIAT